MISRAYNIKIDIKKRGEVEDGFGGVVSGDVVLLKNIWAKVVTRNVGRRFTDYGLNKFENPAIFSIRGKNNIQIDEDCFVEYKGKKFLIKGVEDVNLEGIEINIFCDESKV